MHADPRGLKRDHVQYQFDFATVLERWPLFLQGAWDTVQLAAFSTVFGLLLGVACAMARTSRVAFLRHAIGLYVELIRNTPLLIQVYFLVFGLASAGVVMPIQAGAVLAMVINIGAYATEILRAGIESIKRGQLEAGDCLGLTRAQVFLHVVLAPALERVYPALTSQFVLLMLATSVMSAIGAEELMGAASRVQSETFLNFEVFLVLWALYLALAYLMRAAFWAFGQLVFPRRRKLGTPL